MKLSAWFKAQGVGSKSWLARETGLAYTTVHAIEKGKSTPREETAELIAKATRGCVSVRELRKCSGLSGVKRRSVPPAA